MTNCLENARVFILDWKYITGYNKKYLLNKIGVLVSLKGNGSHKVLESRIDRAGYETVRLFKNGKTNTKFIHRLIAENFLPNEQNKACVNHKNGQKTNNWYQNLEWVSHAENTQHAYDSMLIKNKGRAVVDKCTNKIFDNYKEAAKFYGINPNTLRGYLNGQINNKTCLEYLNS